MILFLILHNYKKDCKLKGKENLAVPLFERLLFYFISTFQLILFYLIELIVIKWLY